MKREIKIVLEIHDIKYGEICDQIIWYLHSLNIPIYAVYMDVGSNKVIEQQHYCMYTYVHHSTIPYILLFYQPMYVNVHQCTLLYTLYSTPQFVRMLRSNSTHPSVLHVRRGLYYVRGTKFPQKANGGSDSSGGMVRCTYTDGAPPRARYWMKRRKLADSVPVVDKKVLFFMSGTLMIGTSIF